MDEFYQQIKGLAKKIDNLKDSIETEEATKTSTIMPFIQLLGYDVFNPEEVVPEFVADVGIKKGEKIDYAIKQGGEPVILIEAKAINEKLDKHDSQLYRYFGTTKAKFAILTNGVQYKFYTDLEEANKMDKKPFFVFDMLDLRDTKIQELEKFKKSGFDVDHVLNTASELKYSSEIKQFIASQWSDPSDEFIKFILADIYQGLKTKKVVDNFRETVKNSLNQFVSEKVNDKLQQALNSTSNTIENEQAQEEAAATTEQEVDNEQTEPEIVTTEEEIEGYVHIKMLLKEHVDTERLYYRDNRSYFNVLLDDNIRRWVCRLGLNSNNKYIQLNDTNKSQYRIDSVEDVLKYKDEIIQVAKQFM
ncbi:type I restriction endonuclease [Tuberibacillus sp. Marseille-P3662]|uniref:type I restriction endonuclease n=1 Tax=Tuberibacillus sp. Marseille-P3662 TaxID=1965358 RepID=UPI000A1CB041|nr:type I restriction endonuclease [Tuberibacillus sp. Marseille-P3662]